MDLKSQILEFLYDQVSQNKIPQIKKGMVEDLEGFIAKLLAELESARAAERMTMQKPDVEKGEEKNDTEENS